MDSLVSVLFTPSAAALLALLIALVLFSTLLGDHPLARLAHHILVGAALGYAALLALREVLAPRVAEAWAGAPGSGWLWVPLLLGGLMWLAGFDYLRRSAEERPLPRWRLLIRRIGMIPVLLLLGIGVTVALIGLWQGTLLPQIGVIAGYESRLTAQPGDLFHALLGLVLTTATLLYLTWPQNWGAGGLPLWLQSPVTVWRWIGLRALWLAAGVLFARLAAARLSLLIGWIENLGRQWQTTGLGELLATLWERLAP